MSSPAPDRLPPEESALGRLPPEAAEPDLAPPVDPPDFPVFSVDASGPEWERLTTDPLYEGPYIQLHSIRYRTPGRPDGGVTWTVAKRKSAVIIAPQLADGRFLLIHQERLPVQRVLWEFPAGQIDHPERREHRSEIIATAVRELAEETGHRLVPGRGRLRSLGYFFSSQGFTDEHAYLFLAGPVEPLPAAGDSRHRPLGEGDEHIAEVMPVTLSQLSDMIASHEIRDANTLCLFARLCAQDGTAMPAGILDESPHQ